MDSEGVRNLTGDPSAEEGERSLSHERPLTAREREVVRRVAIGHATRRSPSTSASRRRGVARILARALSPSKHERERSAARAIRRRPGMGSEADALQ
jgi:hypothetical protein